jgi:hypothetical protein
MPIKAIDKSQSPLWVRILVWILVGGLIAGTLVIAVATMMQLGGAWEDAGSPQPVVISPEDLPPEILAELEAQIAAQDEADGTGDSADDNTVTNENQDTGDESDSQNSE